MNDTDLARWLDLTSKGGWRLSLLMAAVDRNGQNLAQRMRESYQGWPPSSGFDRQRGRIIDELDEGPPLHSDPTGEAAIRADRARDDHRRLHKEAQKAANAVEAMLQIASRYTLRDANPIEREQTEADNEAGCDSCARIAGPRTPSWWNPVKRRTVLADGTLVAVCGWCYEGPLGVRHTGKMPSREALEDYRDGKRFRRPAA